MVTQKKLGAGRTRTWSCVPGMVVAAAAAAAREADTNDAELKRQGLE